MALVDDKKFPKLASLITEVLGVWPEHQRYLAKSLQGRDERLLSHSETLSDMISRLAVTIGGGIRTLAADYRFLCEDIVIPEEIHFRRHDSYRLTSFEEALRTIYSDQKFMTRYMNGLLISDVLWDNHCRSLQHYTEVYLNSLKPGTQLLEIGPGHGLLLHFATKNSKIGKLFAWDVSQASLDMSEHALKALGATQPISFEMKDILDASIMEAQNASRFDGIVFSEVLEHLEEPERALRSLFHLCKPNGRVWINVPANSPAPDHIYLVREPKQAEDLVRCAGFDVVDTANFAMSGVSLDQAIRQKRTVSCVIVGRRPGV